MNFEERKQLKNLVLDVGRELLNYWPARVERELKYKIKDNNTPVTEADELASDMVVSGINQIFPGDFVLSEEGPGLGSRDYSQDTIWFVDPLDGTRTFMSGGNEFSVLLGRAKNGVVDYGIMYFPALGLFAEGIAGGGVTVNGVPVLCGTPQGAARILSRPRTLGAFSGNVIESHVTGRALLGLARGEYNLGIFKLDTFGPHDFAAASIIMREAGGSLINELGQPHFFGKEASPKYIIAGNTELALSVVSKLEEQF
jgi:3'(2'), 5'-bisphosphate nucleotidase